MLKYTIKLELTIKLYNCYVAYYVHAAPKAQHEHNKQHNNYIILQLIRVL